MMDGMIFLGLKHLMMTGIMHLIHSLILAAKTKAILEGRPTPGPEDVRFAAYPVLRHRIVTSFNAEADGVDTLEIIKRILKNVRDGSGS